MFETASDFVLTALLAVTAYGVRELKTQCKILKALVTIAKIRHPKEAEQTGL